MSDFLPLIYVARHCETACQTGPIYWCEPGTDGRHSFYELIHQGARIIPCGFIPFDQPPSHLARHHVILPADVFSLSEALAFGKTPEQVKAEDTPDWLVPTESLKATVLRTRSSPTDSHLNRSANSGLSTSTLFSHRVRSGASTRLINGALSWGRCSPNALSRNSNSSRMSTP